MDVVAIIGLIATIVGVVAATIIGVWQVLLTRKQTRLAEQKMDSISSNIKPRKTLAATPLLDRYQRAWLMALASNSRRSEPVDTRQLFVGMRDILPEDFDPTKINSRLCANGKSITLLGRALLNPNDHHVQQVDLVASTIRDILIERPDRTKVTAAQIANATELPEQEVAIILEEMSGYKGGDLFHNSGTSYGRFGWASINIDDDVLKRYIRFENVQKLLSNVMG